SNDHVAAVRSGHRRPPNRLLDRRLRRTRLVPSPARTGHRPPRPRRPTRPSRRVLLRLQRRIRPTHGRSTQPQTPPSRPTRRPRRRRRPTITESSARTRQGPRRSRPTPRKRQRPRPQPTPDPNSPLRPERRCCARRRRRTTRRQPVRPRTRTRTVRELEADLVRELLDFEKEHGVDARSMLLLLSCYQTDLLREEITHSSAGNGELDLQPEL